MPVKTTYGKSLANGRTYEDPAIIHRNSHGSPPAYPKWSPVVQLMRPPPALRSRKRVSKEVNAAIGPPQSAESLQPTEYRVGESRSKPKKPASQPKKRWRCEAGDRGCQLNGKSGRSPRSRRKSVKPLIHPRVVRVGGALSGTYQGVGGVAGPKNQGRRQNK
jgi:hypothetical protein